MTKLEKMQKAVNEHNIKFNKRRYLIRCDSSNEEIRIHSSSCDIVNRLGFKVPNTDIVGILNMRNPVIWIGPFQSIHEVAVAAREIFDSFQSMLGSKLAGTMKGDDRPNSCLTKDEQNDIDMY